MRNLFAIINTEFICATKNPCKIRRANAIFRKTRYTGAVLSNYGAIVIWNHKSGFIRATIAGIATLSNGKCGIW